MKKTKPSDFFKLAAEYAFMGLHQSTALASYHLNFYFNKWHYLDMVDYTLITRKEHRAMALCLLAAIAEDEENEKTKTKRHFQTGC